MHIKAPHGTRALHEHEHTHEHRAFAAEVHADAAHEHGTTVIRSFGATLVHAHVSHPVISNAPRLDALPSGAHPVDHRVFGARKVTLSVSANGPRVPPQAPPTEEEARRFAEMMTAPARGGPT